MFHRGLSLAAPISIVDPRNPAPAPGQPRPPQLDALTSIRFFAALYVAFFHMVRPFYLWGPFAAFMNAGYVGVSFFFLLSGFILTYAHAREPRTGVRFRRRFWFARFARIYPVYFVVTVLSGILLAYQFDKPLHVVAFAADFLMLQTWSTRMVSFFNIPAWSACVEAFFYIVFPFVFLRMKPRTRRGAIAPVFLWWALGMVLPAMDAIRTRHIPADFVTPYTFWLHRFPPVMLPEFLAGIALGWWFLLYRPSERASAWMAATSVITLPIVLFFSARIPEIMLHDGLLVPLFALLILGLAQPNALSRALSWAPLRLLGEASYAFYLTHFMLNDWMFKHLGINEDKRMLPMKLVLFIAISIALHLGIERPSRSALLQWWNRDHPRTA